LNGSWQTARTGWKVTVGSIRIGTSGFSYDDWVGPVYPAGLPKGAWLETYADQFDTVELNVTYYAMPGERTVHRWADRTPDGFLFSVKAHRTLTHERQDADPAAFVSGLAPLVEAGKLACVLAQFPQSFHRTPENMEYLAWLKQGLAELPLVFEFRHRGWVCQPTYEALKLLGVGFCCVDEPRLPGLMPATVLATGNPGYVRFHGRNAEHWWDHEQAWQRYNYHYRDEELEEWIPGIRQLANEVPLVLVYANNHYRGESVVAGKRLKQLLLGGGEFAA
jgi:uncharacterized protein YecE (DUF72 family)